MSTAAVAFNAEALRHFSVFRNTVRHAMSDEGISGSFDSFSSYIQKPSTLKAALQLLKASRCELLLKPSPRTLLAAFMVAKFPEEILEISEAEMLATADDETRALDRACFDLAKSLVAAFTDEAATLEQCLPILSRFQDLFVEWKEYDRQRMLLSLADAHFQWVASLKHLEDSRAGTRDPEGLEEMVVSVQQQMEANKQRILQMGGPGALEQILSTPPITIDLDQLVMEVGSMAFWNQFAEELRQTPPKYDRIATLLTEIRNRLVALVPNRPDVQRSIESSFDVEFISQMIQFNSFDAASFQSLFNTIWTHLKNFGAAAAEAEWSEWREQMLAKASSGTITWDILLPEIFNRFLVQLDAIEEATRRYRDIMAQSAQSEQIPAPSSS